MGKKRPRALVIRPRTTVFRMRRSRNMGMPRSGGRVARGGPYAAPAARVSAGRHFRCAGRADAPKKTLLTMGEYRRTLCWIASPRSSPAEKESQTGDTS